MEYVHHPSVGVLHHVSLRECDTFDIGVGLCLSTLAAFARHFPRLDGLFISTVRLPRTLEGTGDLHRGSHDSTVPTHPRRKGMFDRPVITAIADKRGSDEAQVLIRWALRGGVRSP